MNKTATLTSKLGIDIAKNSFVVSLLHNSKVCTNSFANQSSGYDELALWLKAQGADKVHASMEATGRYGCELAIWLHAQGHEVSVLNPLTIHAYAKSRLSRNKTDQVDSGLIMQYSNNINAPLPLWQPAPEIVEELRSLLSYLEALKRDQTSWNNRLKAQPASAHVKASLEQRLQGLETEIESLLNHIQTLIEQDNETKQDLTLLTSIPGIGMTTALWLLSIDMKRFADARAVTAFIGLSPHKHESGSSVRKRDKLSKMGNTHLRKALYYPALSALTWNPIIKGLADRLTKRLKPKMVIVGAAMRKLLVLAYGVLHSRQPFSPDFTSKRQGA